MRKKIKRLILTCFLGVTALLGMRWWWGHVWLQITVAPEVTHITAPLRDDGTVNYLAALNARYGAGATHENNASIPLLVSFGAQQYGQPHIHELSLALAAPELESPAPEGKALVPFEAFRLRSMKKHPYDGEEELRWAEEIAALGKTPWNAADHPEAAAWLESSQPVLAEATRASRLPCYFVPELPGPENDTVLSATIGPVSMIRSFTDILAARAMLRLGAGDISGCRDDGLTILRLGELVGHQPTTIERLASYGVIDTGLHVFAAMLESRALSPEQARAFRRDLVALPEIPSFAECIDLYQRYELLDQLTFLARFGPDGMTDHRANSFTFGFTPVCFDRVLRDADRWANRFTEAANWASFSAREAAVAKVSADAAAFVSAAATARERALRSLTTVFFDDLLRPMRLRDNSRQLLDVVVAGYSARAELGATPGSADLDKFMRSIPPDVFTDSPLHADLLNRADGHFLSLGCTGPAPLARRPVVLNGVDLSSNRVQKRFFIEVRLSD